MLLKHHNKSFIFALPWKISSPCIAWYIYSRSNFCKAAMFISTILKSYVPRFTSQHFHDFHTYLHINKWSDMFSAVISDVRPCSTIEVHRRFGETQIWRISEAYHHQTAALLIPLVLRFLPIAWLNLQPSETSANTSIKLYHFIEDSSPAFHSHCCEKNQTQRLSVSVNWQWETSCCWLGILTALGLKLF